MIYLGIFSDAQSKHNFSAFVAFANLSGCHGTLDKLAYQAKVQQGRDYQEQNIAALSSGMNKAQVRAFLGQPVFVTQGEPETWIYHFSLHSQKHEAFWHTDVLTFVADQLAI